MAYLQNINEPARSVRPRTGRRSVQTWQEPEAKTGDCLSRSRKPAVFPKTAGMRFDRPVRTKNRVHPAKPRVQDDGAADNGRPFKRASDFGFTRLPFPAGNQLRAAQTGEASVVFRLPRHPGTAETGNPDTKKAAPGGRRAASLGGITKIRHAMPPVSSAESSSLKAAKAEKLRPANGRLLRQGNGLSLSGIRSVFLPPIRPVSPARPEAAASADRQTGR